MKTSILALSIFGAGVVSCSAAIVEPLVTHISTFAFGDTEQRIGEYKFTFTIFASGGDVFLSRKSTNAPPQFIEPGSGHIWGVTDDAVETIISNGYVVMNSERVTRIGPGSGGDTGYVLRIPANQTMTIEWRELIGAEPWATDEEIGNNYIGVTLKALNWGMTNDPLTPNFLTLDPALFTTEKVLVTGVPEPTTLGMLLVALSVTSARRFRGR